MIATNNIDSISSEQAQTSLIYRYYLLQNLPAPREKRKKRRNFTAPDPPCGNLGRERK
jgi:hypothetical protein